MALLNDDPKQMLLARSHAQGTRVWSMVTCPQCLKTGETWRKYNGEQT